VVGTGFGTIFRYFSYKKWVFLAGAPGTVEAAVSGIVDRTSAAVPAGGLPTGGYGPAGGYGPPWEELEPPADLRYEPAWEHLEPAER
jgi:hypothetical protein